MLASMDGDTREGIIAIATKFDEVKALARELIHDEADLALVLTGIGRAEGRLARLYFAQQGSR
jgi:hypothetical protein